MLRIENARTRARRHARTHARTHTEAAFVREADERSMHVRYMSGTAVSAVSCIGPRPERCGADWDSNSKHWFMTSFLGGRCRKAVLGVWHGV